MRPEYAQPQILTDLDAMFEKEARGKGRHICKVFLTRTEASRLPETKTVTNAGYTYTPAIHMKQDMCNQSEVDRVVMEYGRNVFGVFGAAFLILDDTN